MTFLKLMWKKWLPIAQAVGNFQAQVILTVFYLVLMLPLGLIFRLFADPLRMKETLHPRSNFRKWDHPKEDLERARKQY